MIVYLIAFIVLLIPVFRFDLMKLEGNKTLWMYAEYVILVLIAGLRYRVGGDTLIYMKIFEDYPTIGELSTFDFAEAKYNPMWYIYNSVFKTLGDSFTLFQLCQAILVNLAFFRFFKRYSPQAFFSCVFVYYFGYYCYFNMEILRDALCISIFLEAYPFLEKKKLLQYYLLCIFALLFHMSAVLLFLFPLALLLKKNQFWIGAALMVFVFILLHKIDIVSILLNIAFEGHLAVTVNSYLEKEAPNINGIILNLLVAVPFLALMLIRYIYKYENDQLMGGLLIFVVVIQTIGTFISVAYRFSNYLMPLGIVFILNTFYGNFWDFRKYAFAKIMFCGIFFIYTFNLSYYYIKKAEDTKGARHYRRYAPYYSVLDPQEDKKREQILLNERVYEF